MRDKISINYAIYYRIPKYQIVYTLEIKFIYFLYYTINYQIPKINTKYQNI